MTTDIQFIESLKKDMEGTLQEATQLLWNRKMFKELDMIIKNNSLINVENEFFDFIKVGYISHVVLAICRQIDTDDKTLSLINLMQKIFDNPGKITKEWFTNQYKISEVHLGLSGWGKNDFEKNFGKLKFIDPVIVYSDIGKLIFYTRDIKKYRDKRVAHTENRKINFDKDFGFDTFYKAIDIIEDIVKKYYLLLFQGGFNSLLPIDATDYQKIFYVPWINRKDE